MTQIVRVKRGGGANDFTTANENEIPDRARYIIACVIYSL